MKKGDVIDIVKGFDFMEPDKLIVSRIEILDISSGHSDNTPVSVAIRKYLSCKIDNYAGDEAFESQNRRLLF